MKYYIYFDGYGCSSRVINEEELAAKYNNDPEEFLKEMCGLGPEDRIDRATGHVSTLKFDKEEELQDYLESLGDEIEGFYECRSESRPYNF